MSLVEAARSRLFFREPGLRGWLLLALGPAAVASAFALSGLVTSGLWVAVLSALLMVSGLAVTVALRKRLAR